MDVRSLHRHEGRDPIDHQTVRHCEDTPFPDRFQNIFLRKMVQKPRLVSRINHFHGIFPHHLEKILSAHIDAQTLITIL